MRKSHPFDAIVDRVIAEACDHGQIYIPNGTGVPDLYVELHRYAEPDGAGDPGYCYELWGVNNLLIPLDAWDWQDSADDIWNIQYDLHELVEAGYRIHIMPNPIPLES